MPNQTLYDNFSQVRQYIDQEKPDLSSYVTKSELSNCGYLTSVPSEYITQQELSGNSYATTSELSSYLPLTGGTLNGNLTLGNTYVLTLGTERPWQIYETGTGVGAYIVMKGGSSKKFYVADYYNNPIIEHYSNNSSSDYVKIHTPNTYTCSIVPNTDNTYTLGSHTLTKYFQSAYTHRVYLGNQIRLVDDSGNGSTFAIYQGGVGHYSFEPESFHPYGATYGGNIDLGSSTRTWRSTYTNNLYLNGTDINDTLSTINSNGKLHYGTAVHNRTSYTVTATVDTFETDSNGNPLVGTTICVKLNSITGTNPSTLYPIKFIVNGKELPRWYGNAAVTTNGRNWYRDMNDGTGRYWYWFWDGTYWVWHGISEEKDTTYSTMTDAEASAGTSTTGRLIKPVTLATYYTAKSCFSYDSSTGTLTITI